MERSGQGARCYDFGRDRFVALPGARFERVKALSGSPARRAAGCECTVPSRGGIGGAREPIVFEAEPSPQRGDDEVMRQVLGLVAHSAIPARRDYEQLTNLSQRGHAALYP